MANKTIIVNPNKPQSDDADNTALWVVLLIAFAVVLIAIVGLNKPSSSNSSGRTTLTETTTTTTNP